MEKRELSSTLKNLKFMQRAARKEEKPIKEEEVKSDGNFVSLNTQNRKCIVIMEGNPQPGASKGRMSFQSFNPYIDKLNEEAANPQEPHPSASSSGDEIRSEKGSPHIRSQGSNSSRPDIDSDGDHKRKQPETNTQMQYPNESKRKENGESDQQSLTNKGKGFNKQQKREKLDWSVLRPPKPQNRKG